jgi:hypothetical protein
VGLEEKGHRRGNIRSKGLEVDLPGHPRDTGILVLGNHSRLFGQER